MASVTVLSGAARALSIPETGATVVNNGPDILYYGPTAEVGAQAGSSQLASGGSVTLFGVTYAASPGRCDLSVQAFAAATSVGNGLPSRKFRCRRPKVAVVTSDFASGWSAVSGSLSDDTTTPYLLSSKVLAANASASGRFQNTALTAIDLTANGLVLAARVPDYALVSGSLDVDFSSDAFATFQTGGNLKQDLRVTPVGEWVLHPLQPGSGTNITPTSLTGFRVKGTAGASGYSIGFGLLGTWALDGRTRVVHIIDDSLDTAFEMCMRAIAKGVKPCVAVRPGALDTSGHLTTTQAKTLHDRYGVEFLPHAYNVADHDNTNLYLDANAFEASLKNMRDSLIAKGLVNGIEHYCYAPNYDGSRSTAAQIAAYDLVTKYYPGLARTANTAGYNGTVESQAPYDLERRLRVGMYTTGTNSALANLQGMLDRATFQKGVAITVNHGLAGSASGLVIDRSTYDSFMTEIGVTRAATITSCTLSEAFAA